MKALYTSILHILCNCYRLGVYPGVPHKPVRVLGSLRSGWSKLVCDWGVLVAALSVLCQGQDGVLLMDIRNYENLGGLNLKARAT